MDYPSNLPAFSKEGLLGLLQGLDRFQILPTDELRGVRQGLLSNDPRGTAINLGLLGLGVTPVGKAAKVVKTVKRGNKSEEAPPLYHVTTKANAKGLKEEGFNPFRANPNWSRQGGNVAFDSMGTAFGFSSKKDAAIWASRMEYKLGVPHEDLVIVKLRGGKGWASDLNIPKDHRLPQSSHQIDTVKSPIKPKDVLEVEPYAGFDKRHPEITWD